jgi:predicted ABC-type ATPase
MLAGPNGAGKSTFHELFLAESGLPFVNADLLAASAQLDVYEAARAADAVRQAFIDDGTSFVTETVFSDPAGQKLELLRSAIAASFNVLLAYIGLSSTSLAEARVCARTRAGGHDVPDEKIVARYGRSLMNLAQAADFVPRVLLYDNSSAEDPYRFVAELRAGRVMRTGMHPAPRWATAIIETRT